jgi:uncharacterized protein (DUF3084 family)
MQTQIRTPPIPPAPAGVRTSTPKVAIIASAVVGGLVLTLSLALYVGARTDLANTQAELRVSSRDLAEVRGELAAARNQTADLRSELSDAQTTLAKTQEDLRTTKDAMGHALKCSFGALAAWYETANQSYDATGRALGNIVYSPLCKVARRAYQRTQDGSGLL